jgi:bacterioferritin
MKGDSGVIDYLNRALRSELTAINQYWLHYRLQKDWGFGRLAKKSREESLEEMHHADRIMDRIIFLDGHPNLQVLDPLRIGETPRRRWSATSRPSMRPAPSTSRRATIATGCATTPASSSSRS